MIDLITGLPGNCKTLYTIAWVKEWAEKDGRPVYYSGIPELTLPWTQIDPEKWMECPPKSIVVIDECQRIYRNRSINSQPPKFVTDLETHRHLGIDLVFITQHPMLVDPALRRLTGRHRHCVRKWGMEASTIHEWQQVRENCDKPAGRKDSIKHHWKFDKSIYGLYKSAEVHTVKRNIPWKVKLLFLLPLVLAGLVYKAYDSFAGRIKTDQAQTTTSKPVSVAAPAGAGRVSNDGGKAYLNPVEDAKQFVFLSTPRVEGLPHTAPKFDEVTKPVVAPVPVACVASSTKCLCYTQQGTRMTVRDQQCRDIAEFGFFAEFDPNGRSEKVAQSVAVLDRDTPLPLSGNSTRDVPGRVVVMEPDGYGVLGARGSSSPGKGS